MSKAVSVYGKLPKALNTRLREVPDFATITISKPALKKFIADYDAYAKATGFGSFRLSWYVDPVSKDLSFKIPHSASRIVIESTGLDDNVYWFNYKCGTSDRRIIRSLLDLFDHAHEAYYGHVAEVDSAGVVTKHLLDSIDDKQLRTLFTAYIKPIREHLAPCSNKLSVLVKEYSELAARKEMAQRRAFDGTIKTLRKVITNVQPVRPFSKG